MIEDTSKRNSLVKLLAKVIDFGFFLKLKLVEKVGGNLVDEDLTHMNDVKSRINDEPQNKEC